ncbi:hypothetical protein O6H91_05G012800 [Diphasiastrum complanatum]|uniref:Uncharacterized protein n=2 Tax=Diphasiastrum complanatum TaxID=34168 RepID=A0ACC2DKV2_DIPCM|nr:hypothetical protein O6H91_05G012100 [Diphasiastrum complanatum]KAJ7554860.1 hypothetical protein O6H91_05G012800 [Diphasiastrum complanatum]
MGDSDSKLQPFASQDEVSSSDIFMVQMLIERCLLLYMDREECVKAIAQHADVNPIVTRAVWNGLVKENGEFFSAYERHRADRHDVFASQALVAARAKLQCPNQRNENLRSGDPYK